MSGIELFSLCSAALFLRYKIFKVVTIDVETSVDYCYVWFSCCVGFQQKDFILLVWILISVSLYSSICGCTVAELFPCPVKAVLTSFIE